MKSFLWSRIAEPIINKITDNALQKAKSFVNDIQKQKFKEQFIEKLDEELLNEYGDESFYDELSHLIINIDILDLIYDRCYEIRKNDFRTDEQFINCIVEKSNTEFVLKNNLHDAIKHIFDTFFHVLNQPEYGDTRKIINHLIGLRNEQREFRNENKKDNNEILKLLRERPPASRENTNIKESRLNNIFTSQPTNYGSKLVGRDAMIDKAINKLKDSGLAVLTGMGGIGKTSIAKKIFNNSSYDYKGFVSYEENMKTSIVSALEYNSGIQFEKDSDIDKKIYAIENMINNTEGRKLLIVDNVNTLLTEDNSINVLNRLNCHILITSRCQLFDKDKNITIEFLDKDECIELLKRYYTLGDNKEKISEIVELAGRHTMTIELLAKTGEDGNYQLDEILDKLHDNGFDLTGIYEEITSDWDNGETEDRLFEHLKKVFSFCQLEYKEKQLLEKITLLTKNQISIDVLKNILELTNLNELNKLAKKGWIEKDRSNIFIHNIVWEIVSKQYELVEDEVLRIIAKVANILYDDNNAVYNRVKPYVNPAILLLYRFYNIKSGKLVILANNIFHFYESDYEYSKALVIGMYAIELSKKLSGLKSVDVAYLCYSVSKIYHNKGDVELTIEYADKSLEILEMNNIYNNVFAYVLHMKAIALSQMEEFHKSNIISFKCIDVYNEIAKDCYHNKAKTYHQIGYNFMGIANINDDNVKYIKMSEYYLLKSLFINESKFGKNSTECVIPLKDLAQNYLLQKKYLKAEELVWRAISNSKDNSNSIIGGLYNTLAFILEDNAECNKKDKKTEYRKSLKYRIMSLNILLQTYKEPHINIVSAYNNLGCTNEKLKEYGDALFNFKNALKILNKLEENHFRVKGDICINLARLYSNSPLNNSKRAICFIEQALDVYKINNISIDNSFVIETLEGYRRITGKEYDYNID